MHVTFYEYIYPAGSRVMENVIEEDVNSKVGPCTANETMCTIQTQISVDTKHQDVERGNIVSNDNRNAFEGSDIKKDATEGGAFKKRQCGTILRRYPQQNRKIPGRFTINALSQTRTDDEPIAAKALKRDDAENFCSVMWAEICFI